MRTATEASRQSPPLWRQLQVVARLVQGVRQGRSLTAQLPEVDPGLRPGVQALTFHALRWLGRAEALRSHLVARTPAAKPDALLCVALSLVAAEGPELYPSFTLVDQTVEAAKRDAGMRASAALINACLRRALRELDVLLQSIPGSAVARWNHQAWWVDRLRVDHPVAWTEVLEADQQAAPMVLRVNARRMTAQAYCERLAAAGIEARPLHGQAVELAQPRPVQALPGFSTGDVSIQSVAAQLAAPLLLSGLRIDAPRILDACAAPGGKTAHLLELFPKARVTALEVDAERSARIGQNLDRLGLDAQVLVADAADTAAWWRGEPFDAILVDAPCSASGIVRRHPDVRWLRRSTDIAQLAVQQDRLLAVLWPLLAPGGRMLYCTCSVFRAEGDERIQAFLAHHNDASPLPSPGHLLPRVGSARSQLGDNGGCDDGFFYALLEKRLD
ncbi:MAG: 16S rRNA (cytosine(967)-C(5))-methyltransferase RsmB [Burkholderiaceae bacterium]|nr:16S rRNA (cytosine(967)-C(5))-methyltransferase RsmB [Burkholderiaceae bacterium]